MNAQKIRGRAAQSNPKNRFERMYIDKSNPEFESYFAEDNGELQIKTEYFKDDSKSVISTNDSYDIFFDYSFNPYRGCEHGCIYCYARPTHEFLGFSSGTDFETKIMVKENAPRLLEEHFNNKNYVPDLIMFSGNTDCYQPVERKLKITRSALKICLKYKNPVSIITKNSLILRDVDILQELARLNLVSVVISITSLDKELLSKMEPRTSTPERRLKTIEEIAQNNIPVGVNVAPVIPGLNDHEIPEILNESSNSGAKFANYIILRLPLSVKELFIDWLQHEFPDRSAKILNRIRDIRGGKLNESEFGKRFKGEGELAEAIHDLFDLSCKKYGLNQTRIKLRTDLFHKKKDNQLKLF
ncbi:MAG: PA0069 family radical SAM protein [Bacteroidetes bacterium]|nr:PA0069 family radical SAM protein [Bacteroidota bacterium]